MQEDDMPIHYPRVGQLLQSVTLDLDLDPDLCEQV